MFALPEPRKCDRTCDYSIGLIVLSIDRLLTLYELSDIGTTPRTCNANKLVASADFAHMQYLYSFFVACTYGIDDLTILSHNMNDLRGCLEA